MLTLPTDENRESTDLLDRPAYRPYRAQVCALRRLSPHFVRVTFTGEEFEHFGTAGLDQRVKVVLPIEGFGLADLGSDGATWYETWRGLPAHERNPFRTYTVRSIHPERRELEVDFVAHDPGEGGSLGPAAAWLASVRLGSDVVIVGPDERSPKRAIGLDWHPGNATEVLLCGDETAAPAIASILGSLSDGVAATAFIEVPDAADALDLELPSGTSVTWLARGEAPLGERLERAVRDWVAQNPEPVRAALAGTDQLVPDVDVDRDLLWDSPTEAPGEFYAWIAGEAAVVKMLRRFLVSETGVDRARVAFMGYWRHGRSESQ